MQLKLTISFFFCFSLLSCQNSFDYDLASTDQKLRVDTESVTLILSCTTTLTLTVTIVLFVIASWRLKMLESVTVLNWSEQGDAVQKWTVSKTGSCLYSCVSHTRSIASKHYHTNICVSVSAQPHSLKTLLRTFSLVWPTSSLCCLCFHAWMFPWQSWTSPSAAVCPSSLKTSQTVCVCVSLGSPPQPAKRNPRSGNISPWITGKLAAFSVFCRLFLIRLLLCGNIAASLLAPVARCNRSLRAVSKKGEQLSSVGQRLPPPSLRLFTLHIFASVAPDPLLCFISSLCTKIHFTGVSVSKLLLSAFKAASFYFFFRNLMTFSDSSFFPPNLVPTEVYFSRDILSGVKQKYER